MSDSDVQVKFGATTGELDSGIAHVKEKLAEIGENGKKLAEGMKQVGEAILAAFAVEKVAEFVEKMAALGTQTERTAAILGISTKEVGEFSLIAGLSGGSAEGMSKALERLQVNLGKTGTETSPAAQALKALGLSAKDLVGIPMPAQLDKIADAMSKFADGGNKTAIAIALLGRAGAEMIPIFDKGKAGLDEIRAKAADYATTLSEKTTKSLHGVHEASTTLSAAMSSLGATIVSQFANSIIDGTNALGKLAAGINVLIQGGKLWDALCEGMSYIWNQFVQNLITGGKIIKDVLSLNWGEITSHWKEGLAAQKKLTEDHIASLVAMVADAKAELAKIDHEEHKKPDPGAIGGDGGAAKAAAVAKEIEGEIKLLQMGLTQQKLILDQSVAQHKISLSEKFQSLMDWTTDTYDTENQLLERERGLYAKGTKEYQVVQNKLLELKQKFATDSLKISGDAIAEEQKKWESMLGTISSAFNSQLRGLLAGTTSWGQAMKKLLGDLIIKFIEFEESTLLKHLATELAKTTGTVEGATARTAAEEAGQGAGIAMAIASAIKAIMTDSAKTFAGIFAFLAPEMGPAAAGPAAAGAGVVAAAAGALPALDVGTPWVMKSGLAMIHQGEAVVPAQVNQAWQGRDGGGGGGHTINVNYSPKGRMMTSEIKEHARTIAKEVGDALRNNPSMRRDHWNF